MEDRTIKDFSGCGFKEYKSLVTNKISRKEEVIFARKEHHHYKITNGQALWEYYPESKFIKEYVKVDVVRKN